MNAPKWNRDQTSSLDYLELESPNADCAVILLHGYGADCTDLVPLSQYMKLEASVSWYFPNAPLEVPIGPHMMGRAWFPINMERLTMAQQTGEFERYLAAHSPDGFLAASESVAQFVTGIKERYSKIILGGFSQGSMVSAQVALENPSLLSGLILLSSTFVSEASWRDLVAGEITYPILQSHGSFDPILPYEHAKRLSDFLSEHTADYEFIPFQGGHEIPPPVLTGMQKLINRVGRS